MPRKDIKITQEEINKLWDKFFKDFPGTKGNNAKNLFDISVFPYQYDETPENKKKEYYLTDVVDAISEKAESLRYTKDKMMSKILSGYFTGYEQKIDKEIAEKQKASDEAAEINDRDFRENFVQDEGEPQVSIQSPLGRMINSIKKVDPFYVKSSEEFKAVKAGLLEMDKIRESFKKGEKPTPEKIAKLQEITDEIAIYADMYINKKEAKYGGKENVRTDANDLEYKRYCAILSIKDDMKKMKADLAVAFERSVTVLNRREEKKNEIDNVGYFKEKIAPKLNEAYEDSNEWVIIDAEKLKDITNKAIGNGKLNEKGLSNYKEMLQAKKDGLYFTCMDMNANVKNKDNDQKLSDIKFKPNLLAFTNAIKGAIAEKIANENPEAFNKLDWNKFSENVKSYVNKEFKNELKKISVMDMLKDLSPAEGLDKIADKAIEELGYGKKLENTISI